MSYKLTAEDRVFLLKALWAKERELGVQLQFRIENNFPDDIIAQYRNDIEKCKQLDSEFLNWSL